MDVNLIAPINQLGYGVVGYNILKSLDRNGFNVSLFLIGNNSWSRNDESTELINRTRKNSERYNANATSVRIWHQFELDMFPGKGKRIGWPIFELDKFNDRELHHLNSVDELIVCSKWAKSVIEKNGINVPTFVVPLGIDEEVFFFDEKEKKNRPYWTKDSTIFINVGKWEKRKGHEELCAAFNTAFKPGDNVELWMMNENPFIGPENDEWKRKYVEAPMCGHVRFIQRLSNHEHLCKIFNHVDCGVFPSHAEGWNLEILELMACGAHIIATNYSGHTEYVNNDNTFLIEPNGMEIADDGKWFNGQGSWCTFDVDDLVDKMKEVHELKQSKQLVINEVGLQTARIFSWNNSVNAMMPLIETLEPVA